jgi:hypothetical protein
MAVKSSGLLERMASFIPPAAKASSMAGTPG